MHTRWGWTDTQRFPSDPQLPSGASHSHWPVLCSTLPQASPPACSPHHTFPAVPSPETPALHVAPRTYWRDDMWRVLRSARRYLLVLGPGGDFLTGHGDVGSWALDVAS